MATTRFSISGLFTRPVGNFGNKSNASVIQNVLYTIYIEYSSRIVIVQGKSLRTTVPIEESNKTVMIQGKSLRTTVPVGESNKTVFIPKQKGRGV